MHKIKFLKNRKNRKYIYIGIAILIAAAVIFYFINSGDNGNDTATIREGTIVQSVLATGKIVAVNSVSLGFEGSGKVAELYVDVGTRVAKGQLLARLDAGELFADLKKAEAEVAIKRAEAGGEEIKLDEIKKEQAALVDSAYAKLLSDDLAVISDSSPDGVEPPTVTGLYKGGEGTYKIIIDRSASSFNDYTLRVFGLEKTAPVEILENEPTAIGTRGLFMSFSDDISDYHNTIWLISIPNKKGASYLTNYSAYTEAVKTSNRVIADAESRLSVYNGGVTVSSAELARAQAEVSKIQAQISKKSLRAPFDGLVTKRDIELGEIVSPNTGVISIVSDNDLEIEAFVSEINIGKIAIENPVSFTLDAYEGEIFNGRVEYIDPAETIIDGVVNYKVIVSLDSDIQVKSGLTANLTFTTGEKPNVLIVPQYAITKEGDKLFVYRSVGGGDFEKTGITTGIVGQGGDTEVIFGLSAGDLVRVNTKN